MSQENVEIVQASFAAWARGGSDALTEFLDPDIEWTLRPDFPDAGIFRGHDEVRALFGRFEDTFDDLGVEPIEFIDAGDQVVVPLNWFGRGKESGATVAERQGETWVFTVRAEKVVVVTEYRRKAEALEAAGLSQRAMSEQNVEVMRRAMDAFNRRDGEAFDALLEADAVIVPVRAALEGTTYRGPDAGTQYCVAVDLSWENLSWELEEIRSGEDWVLALGHIRGHGRDSGVAIDARAGWMSRFRQGRIARFQTHADRARALEAAGLSE